MKPTASECKLDQNGDYAQDHKQPDDHPGPDVTCGGHADILIQSLKPIGSVDGINPVNYRISPMTWMDKALVEHKRRPSDLANHWLIISRVIQ
jgi:hypothetical protein